jgi:hypothetical protein
LNQILKRQTSRSHYGSKAPAVTVTVFKYRNKIGKIVVKTVPFSVNVNDGDEVMELWLKSLKINVMIY